MPENRTLKTTAAVIDALGGNTPFLKIINVDLPADEKRGQQHVTNYRATGRFPSDTYLLVTTALARIKASAPPSLWKIREVKKARAA